MSSFDSSAWMEKNKCFSYKKLDAAFSKPVFHVENHSGGAVKTWHVNALNLIASLKKRDSLSGQTWMFEAWNNAEKSSPFTVARKW